MKTQTTSQGLYLRKTNNRWRWMAGATAVGAAAAATASQAATVTVTLNNNYLSSSLNGGANSLNADLFSGMGDNTPIIAFSGVKTNFGESFVSAVINSLKGLTPFSAGGQRASASIDSGSAKAKVGSHQSNPPFPTTASVTGIIPITFVDSNINGGAATVGYLTVNAFTTQPYGNGVDAPSISFPFYSAVIQLTSFSYNAASSVPESGSTLALLALGAGGVIALRRRRKAA